MTSMIITILVGSVLIIFYQFTLDKIWQDLRSEKFGENDIVKFLGFNLGLVIMCGAYFSGLNTEEDISQYF
jgi:hypothetical protein